MTERNEFYDPDGVFPYREYITPGLCPDPARVLLINEGTRPLTVNETPITAHKVLDTQQAAVRLEGEILGKGNLVTIAILELANKTPIEIAALARKYRRTTQADIQRKLGTE